MDQKLLASSSAADPRSTIFEPVVVAAVDLNELTEAFSAHTRWLRTLAALGAGLPDASGVEPLAQRLEPDRNSVELGRFSRASVGPKFQIAIAYEIGDVLFERIRQRSVGYCRLFHAADSGQPNATFLCGRKATLLNGPYSP